MTGVIDVSSQRRLGRKKEEFMWNELNRILVVNRKDELAEADRGSEAATRKPVNEPDSVPVAQSPNGPEPREASRDGIPENSGARPDDGPGASPADTAAGARQLRTKQFSTPT